MYMGAFGRAGYVGGTKVLDHVAMSEPTDQFVALPFPGPTNWETSLKQLEALCVSPLYDVVTFIFEPFLTLRRFSRYLMRS